MKFYFLIALIKICYDVDANMGVLFCFMIVFFKLEICMENHIEIILWRSLEEKASWFGVPFLL